MDCTICCEKYNGRRKEISCNYCEQSSCVLCAKKFILGSNEDVNCMFCKRDWSYEFIDANFDNTFRTKDLVKHREEILYEREKALLPATQAQVETILHRKQLDERRKELLEQKKEIDMLLNEIKFDYNNCQNNEKRQMIRACPNNECRGFLDETWKCGICSSKVCKTCEEIQGENHVCNNDVLETIKLLQRDSKRCPKCPAIIFKIDGCSQMFCVKCHAVFNWNTGKIETGRVHNPEYYKWLRDHDMEIPREPGDAPDGNENIHCANPLDLLPSYNAIRKFVKDQKISNNEFDILYHIHRMVNHIRFTVFESFERQSLFDRNQHLRVKFMLKEIDEKQFRTLLQRHEKANRKCMAFRDLFQLVLIVVTEAFSKLLINKEFNQFYETVKTITDYGVEQCEAVDQRFNACNVSYREMIQSLCYIV
jgi:hypothetical protein